MVAEPADITASSPSQGTRRKREREILCARPSPPSNHVVGQLEAVAVTREPVSAAEDAALELGVQRMKLGW
jgi:hypothetical protein